MGALWKSGRKGGGEVDGRNAFCPACNLSLGDRATAKKDVYPEPSALFGRCLSMDIRDGKQT